MVMRMLPLVITSIHYMGQ